MARRSVREYLSSLKMSVRALIRSSCEFAFYINMGGEDVPSGFSLRQVCLPPSKCLMSIRGELFMHMVRCSNLVQIFPLRDSDDEGGGAGLLVPETHRGPFDFSCSGVGVFPTALGVGGLRDSWWESEKPQVFVVFRSKEGLVAYPQRPDTNDF
jgi:hypothetical protein